MTCNLDGYIWIEHSCLFYVVLLISAFYVAVYPMADRIVISYVGWS